MPVLAGCVTGGAAGTSIAAANTSSQVGTQNAKLGGTPITVSSVAGASAGAASSEDYRLSPLDVVEISVFQVPDLNRTAQVNTGGMVSLPLIGAVRAGGKTVREFEQEITRLYGARYLQSPQITVFVKEYTSQRVTVDGAVNAPGVYQLAGNATLLQAIALAKGLDRTGDESGVMIFRVVNGQRTGAVFDLRQIRTGKLPDPRLVGGDTIVIDQSAAATAWRAVRESVGVIGAFRPVWF